MSLDDHRGIDHLDTALDHAMNGDRRPFAVPSDTDNLIRVHRHVEARDRTPGPDSAFVEQLLEDIMHAATHPFTCTGHLAPPDPEPRLARHRMLAVPQIAMHRRWGFTSLASAILFLIAIGVGFLVLDPFGGPNRPSSIPAAFAPIASPDAAAPTATPFPGDDHAIIGAWEVQWTSCVAGTSPSRMLFDPDGTFVEYDSDRGVGIGQWRATGERTVEVVAIVQRYASLESMFGVAENLPLPESFEVTGNDGAMQVISYTIEVDETGMSFNAQGFYEPRTADGSVIVHFEYGTDCPIGIPAYRMATVERTATP